MNPSSFASACENYGVSWLWASASPYPSSMPTSSNAPASVTATSLPRRRLQPRLPAEDRPGHRLRIYEQLRSGEIEIEARRSPSALVVLPQGPQDRQPPRRRNPPRRLSAGPPLACLPKDTAMKPLVIRGAQMSPIVTQKLMLFFPRCSAKSPSSTTSSRTITLSSTSTALKVTPEEEGYLVLDVTGTEEDIAGDGLRPHLPTSRSTPPAAASSATTNAVRTAARAWPSARPARCISPVPPHAKSRTARPSASNASSASRSARSAHVRRPSDQTGR